MKPAPTKQIGKLRCSWEWLVERLKLPPDAVGIDIVFYPEQMVDIIFTSKSCPYVIELNDIPLVDNKGKIK